MIGRLFEGARFEVADVRENNEDGYIAAVCNSVVLGLDNADSRVSWLEDTLALYATGHEVRKRKLYSNNEMASYRPRALLLLASRNPHFRRDDVAQRLLQFYFAAPHAYEPESMLFKDLENSRGEVMGAALQYAGLIADALAEMPLPPSNFRMADFAAFGDVAMRVFGRGEEWKPLLAKLVGVQSDFAAEGNPLVETLGILLERPGEDLSRTDTVSLYQMCREVAPSWASKFFKSARSFSQVLANMKPEIEKALDVEITLEKCGKKRFVHIVRRTHDKMPEMGES
jgi:hypothetical protein